MVRSVFRIIEYIQGNNGYLLGREIWLYMFDATLMATVMLLFCVVHPSEINVWVDGMMVAKFPLRVQRMEKVQDSSSDDDGRPQQDIRAGQSPV